MPGEVDLAPGQEWVVADASYEVTERDITAGSASVTFEAAAAGTQQRVVHRFDTTSGAVQVE